MIVDGGVTLVMLAAVSGVEELTLLAASLQAAGAALAAASLLLVQAGEALPFLKALKNGCITANDRQVQQNGMFNLPTE